MGRALSWTDEEAMNLARAWVAASGDIITGIAQTAARFTVTLHKTFVILAQTDDKSNRRYKSHSLK